MKKIRSFSPKVKGLFSAGLAVLLASALFLQRTQAAPGQFAITGTGSVLNGNTITVGLRIHPVSEVDGIEATLVYDQSKLQYVSTNASGSDFTTQLLAPTGGGGTVKIARGISPGDMPVSGDSFIANVTFKALVGSGAVSLNLSGDVTRLGSSVPTAAGGGSVTLTSPAPAPSPTPTPTPNPTPGTRPTPSPTTPSPSPSPTPGTRPTPSPSPTTPTPSPDGGNNKDKTRKFDIDVRKSRIEFNRAVLEAIAKEKVRVYVKYGIKKDQLSISTPLTDFKEDHKVELQSAALTPATTYYYQVVVEDQKGNTTQSNVSDFKTKGFTIRLLVGDKSEIPLRRKRVTLHSEPMAATTDEDGYVTFEGVAAGNHRLEYEQGGQTYSESVTVSEPRIRTDQAGNQTADLASYAAFFGNLQVDNSRAPGLMLPATIAAVLALIVAGVLILRRRNNAFSWQPAALSDPFRSATNAAAPSNDLINRVPGVKKPDPGTVVAPNRNDKDQGSVQ